MLPEIILNEAAEVNTEPIVSIIVPAYNAEDFLDECLASINNQTYSNYEVLIVDDGSTDDTSDIAMKYVKSNDRFHLLRQSNKGVSAARNLALSTLGGDYVMFVDSDDWIESNCIERVIEAAIYHDADIVVMEYIEFTYPARKEHAIKLKDLSEMSFPDLIADDGTLYGGFAWNKIIRRECITHEYHEDYFYYENLVFFLENTNMNTKYYLLHEPLYHYRIHSDSAVHSGTWNPRRITMLAALECAMGYIPERLLSFYEYLYINRLCWIEETAKRECVQYDLSLEKRRARLYYKELMSSNDISFTYKLRALLIQYLPAIYALYIKMGVK